MENDIDAEIEEIISYWEEEIDGLLESIFEHRNLTEALANRFVIRFKRLYRPENEYETIIKGLEKFLYYLERKDSRNVWE